MGGKDVLVYLTNIDSSGQNNFRQTNVAVLLRAQGSHQRDTSRYAKPYMNVGEPTSSLLLSLLQLESALLHS
jgi:hypothetical protein